jgi:hypothetical protein
VEHTCRRCGTTGAAPDDGLPEGWSLDATGRRTAFLCGGCTRAHVRDIEARLSEEWWG